MKKFILLLFFLVFFSNITVACHDATITQLSAVDNGNNTYTYQLRVCFGTGAGSNTYGFWLNFTGGNLIGYPASVTGPSTGNVKPASLPPVSGTGTIEYGVWNNTTSPLLSGTGSTDCLTLTLTFDAPITGATFGGFQPGLSCGATPKTITTTSCFAALASYTITIKVKNCNNNNVSWSLDGTNIVSNITTNGSTYSWIYCGGCKSTFGISASATGGNCPGGVDSWSISSNGTVIASGSNTGVAVGPVNVSACTTLPITLLSFDVKKGNTNDVNINWATASEINNDFFTIERSIDGENYEILGTVSGFGYSNINRNYSFTDKSPKIGTNYYRLKQTDYDGKFEYFDPKAIKINSGEIVNIYPNPTTGSVKVSFQSNLGDDILIRIYPVNGNIIFETNITSNGEFISEEVYLANKGMYLVEIRVNGNITREKIIRQ